MHLTCLALPVSTALLTVMAAAWLVNETLPKIAYLTW